MMISVGYGYLFGYNSEIFPTQFRAITMGTALFIARIFTAITPFAIDLAHSLKIHPMVLACSTAILCLPLLPFMPETKGKKIEN